MWWVKALAGFARVLVSNFIPFLTVIFRSRTSLIAENLLLRKQLAFYQERKRKPRLLTDAARGRQVRSRELIKADLQLVRTKDEPLILYHWRQCFRQLKKRR